MLRELAEQGDGRSRMIVQKLQVPDAAVVERLATQAVKGDEIAAVVVTEWTNGGYRTFLADFRTIAVSATDAPILVSAARPR